MTQAFFREGIEIRRIQHILFLFASILAASSAGAVTPNELRGCALHPADAIVDYEHGQVFLFKGSELYRLFLPTVGRANEILRPVPADIFPSEKQNCFAFERMGRVKFDDMTGEEFRACQKQKPVGFALATGLKMNDATEAALFQWWDAAQEISSAIGNATPMARAFTNRRLAELTTAFKNCESLTGLSAKAKTSLAETKDLFGHLSGLAAQKSREEPRYARKAAK